MKTITFLTLLFLLPLAGIAQNKQLDDIFGKFENSPGVTSVSISKDMMNFVAQIDSEDVKCKNLLSQIAKVRILAFQKASPEIKSDFHAMVKSLPLSDYKEMMVVKDKGQNIKILLKESQGKVSEFLLLVTGDKEPVMVSIVGNIDPKELGKLSSDINLNGFKYFAHINKGTK